MNGEYLRLYAWADAPEEYRVLSTNGGDEDWVLVGPEDHPAWERLFWDGFLEGETFLGVAEWTYLHGEKIVIFSHA